MNYRHAFHAGNFADVVKHAVLTRILVHLREKPAAFRVIDTHAGAALYDLAGPEATRTGEWRHGIGRLRAAQLPPEIAALLGPYLEAVAVVSPGAEPNRYPGSPLVALHLLRPQDRLIACELEPAAAAALARALGGSALAKSVAIDGYVALNAYLPPKERRGLVLIDPPFEQADEFSRLAHALVKAWRKWPTGIFMAWYPLKDRRDAAAFGRGLADGVLRAILRAEIEVDVSGAGLGAAGIVVINPPWRLAGELKILLAWLARLLAQGPNFSDRLDWIRGEA
jgi:23S rRNA (adenine2030-N6)-methyltransferase